METSRGMNVDCFVVCQDGLMYNKGECVDIDECVDQPCHEQAICNNTLGKLSPYPSDAVFIFDNLAAVCVKRKIARSHFLPGL